MMPSGKPESEEVVVGVTDHVRPPYDIEEEALGSDARFVFLGGDRDGALSDPELLSRLDALLVWHAPITGQTVRHLRRCKVVVRYGVGYDNLDLEALREAGIPAANTPDYGTEEVADTAVAMLLTLSRKVLAYDDLSRDLENDWQENVLPPLSRSCRRTAGVLGVGRIGTAVINRLRPFGFRIIGYDPYQPAGHEKGVGYERVWDLPSFLSRCNLVTLHCPLTDETHGMVDRDFLMQLPESAVLVNTARGGLVRDLDLLLDALRTDQLYGIGLDVLPDEPPLLHPLLEAWRERQSWCRGRILINPHTAYFSDEARWEMRFKAAETAALFLSTGRLRNRLLP